MGAGKILVIIGAILTLVSTFFLSLISFDNPSTLLWMETGGTYANGLNFFMHIVDIFTDVDNVASELATESYMVYIIAIVLIIFAISGIIQLIGIKSRVAAIIGSLLPLFIGILILLGSFFTLPDIFNGFVFLQYDGALVDGIVPYDLPLGDVSLGTYTLIAGGALALVGGILGTSDF